MKTIHLTFHESYSLKPKVTKTGAQHHTYICIQRDITRDISAVQILTRRSRQPHGIGYA
jgi:hypothetical protein